ncbi:hypothetical protein [Nesterenkonia sp. CF4.4]|uniref:hypothetical protein n=1 Tax=Nesterenkonia sp. CF4.4 TaxID=3373079 RepID=UPI003EE4B3A1
MSDTTFVPRVEEHSFPPVAGVTSKLKGSLTIHTGDNDTPAQAPDKTEFYLSDMFDGPDDENQLHALQLVIVDPAGQNVWIDAGPEQLERLGEWLIREAQKLHGGEGL